MDQSASNDDINDDINDDNEVKVSASALPKVKLPYFHRTLSEEERVLIGDITPKKIDDNSTNNTTNDSITITSSSSSSSSGGESILSTSNATNLVQGSAWNAAKIWEERDYTPWAIDHLRIVFCDEPLEYKHNDVSVAITDAESISGFANLTCSRGKPRYMYSLGFTLKVEVDVVDGQYIGSVVVEDCVNDMLDDIELSITWTMKPSNTRLKECNAAVTGKAMKEFIKAKMITFERDFHSL